jgi:hypothetical protein
MLTALGPKKQNVPFFIEHQRADTAESTAR